MDEACVFCGGECLEPMMTYYRCKIIQLFQLVSPEILVGKNVCIRCRLNMDMIENAFKLKEIMQNSINSKYLNHRIENHRSPEDTKDLSANHPDQTEVNKEQSESIRTNQPHEISVSPLTPTHATNGGNTWSYNGQLSSTGKRIQSCHECHISLKTRSFKDALKHIQRCKGQGIRKGRPTLHPRPDMFPCLTCGRKLATREAHQAHTAKCDGSNNNNRGRKPADNTCMLCDEDLVYRHILKKHLRVKHGINAQRLDDSVLAALRTGIGTGILAKEHVLSQIQQKLLQSDTTDEGNIHGEEADIQEENQDMETIDDINDANTDDTDDQDIQSRQTDQSNTLDETDELDYQKPPDLSANHNHGTRSRRKHPPTKYIAELFSCYLCSKQFEHKVQYEQHCCFAMNESANDSNPMHPQNHRNKDCSLEQQPLV